EYTRLNRSKLNTERLYSMVLERTKEADLAQMMRVNNISVVDEPVLPQTPVFPRVPLNLAFGLFLGVFAGVGAALGRGVLDRTIELPEEVESELGVPCIGLVPTTKKAMAGPPSPKRKRGKRVDRPGKPELLVHNEPFSAMAEAARSIRTNLVFMSPDKPFEVLLVTSAVASEGKTTVASAIATAIAQSGQRVALFDCDFRRPRVHRIFDIDLEEGLTLAMVENNFDEVIHETEVPNLSVVPSGPIPPNPAELLLSERFQKLIDHARTRFDRIVIDSPPIAAVTDPAILSTIADATVVVVRAHRTRKEAVRHVRRTLGGVGGKVVGAVLNAVDFSKSQYSGEYYYYRRNGYYGEGPKSSPREAEVAASEERAAS
ncbi:MAG: polysaccharide biosynthesis tyrosine autokinase, partial [Myxococcota bacterium]